MKSSSSSSPKAAKKTETKKKIEKTVVFTFLPHLVEHEEAEEEEDFSEKMYKRSGRKDADILRELICNETVEKIFFEKKHLSFQHQRDIFFPLTRKKKSSRVFNFTHPMMSH